MNLDKDNVRMFIDSLHNNVYERNQDIQNLNTEINDLKYQLEQKQIILKNMEERIKVLKHTIDYYKEIYTKLDKPKSECV
jgi:cell division septum initiation protein DivIVA